MWIGMGENKNLNLLFLSTQALEDNVAQGAGVENIPDSPLLGFDLNGPSNRMDLCELGWSPLPFHI